MLKNCSGPGYTSNKMKNTDLKFLTLPNQIPKQCRIEECSAWLPAIYVRLPQANCGTQIHYM